MTVKHNNNNNNNNKIARVFLDNNNNKVQKSVLFHQKKNPLHLLKMESQTLENILVIYLMGD